MDVPFVVIEPMVLFEMFTAALLDERMPKVVPPAAGSRDGNRTRACPAADCVARGRPDIYRAVLHINPAPHAGRGGGMEEVQTMFLMVLPCTLLGVVVPTLS